MQSRLAFDLSHQAFVAFGGMAIKRHCVEDQRLGDAEPIHFREQLRNRHRLAQGRVNRTPSQHAIGVEKIQFVPFPPRYWATLRIALPTCSTASSGTSVNAGKETIRSHTSSV